MKDINFVCTQCAKLFTMPRGARQCPNCDGELKRDDNRPMETLDLKEALDELQRVLVQEQDYTDWVNESSMGYHIEDLYATVAPLKLFIEWLNDDEVVREEIWDRFSFAWPVPEKLEMSVSSEDLPIVAAANKDGMEFTAGVGYASIGGMAAGKLYLVQSGGLKFAESDRNMAFAWLCGAGMTREEAARLLERAEIALEAEEQGEAVG